MKKYSLYCLFIVGFLSAQNTYIDPTTTLALKSQGDAIKQGHQEIIDKQTKLQKAQAFVASQMVIVNDIQSKIRKGLSEVSGTVSNGMQVKNILQELDWSRKYTTEIAQLIKTNPAYAVFGKKSAEMSWQYITRIVTDLQHTLAEGDLNLATAGDRYKMLYTIEKNVSMLRLWLYNVKSSIERAKRYGFWKAINPFQSYINTDKQIIKEIINRYKYVL